MLSQLKGSQTHATWKFWSRTRTMSPLYWVGLPLMLTVLGVDGQDRRVPVGQALGVVVEVRDRVLPHRGQLGVDGVDVRLAQGVAGQVDLPQRVRTPEADRLAAQQEDRAARHEARGEAGERVGHRVVIPDDVARQVRRQGIDGAVRGAIPMWKTMF